MAKQSSTATTFGKETRRLGNIRRRAGLSSRWPMRTRCSYNARRLACLRASVAAVLAENREARNARRSSLVAASSAIPRSPRKAASCRRTETYARSVCAEARSTCARCAAKASISGDMPRIVPASGHVRQKHASLSGRHDRVDDAPSRVIGESGARVHLLHERLHPSGGGTRGGDHGKIDRARRAAMRLLHEDALPVAREIESGHVGGEHFGRASPERRAQQRATPRSSRAPRLVIQGRAVGRERPAVDPFIEAARLEAGGGEMHAPERQLRKALFRRLGEAQHTPSQHPEAL